MYAHSCSETVIEVAPSLLNYLVNPLVAVEFEKQGTHITMRRFQQTVHLKPQFEQYEPLAFKDLSLHALEFVTVDICDAHRPSFLFVNLCAAKVYFEYLVEHQSYVS
jgi:hypothetical protein